MSGYNTFLGLGRPTWWVMHFPAQCCVLPELIRALREQPVGGSTKPAVSPQRAEQKETIKRHPQATHTRHTQPTDTETSTEKQTTLTTASTQVTDSQLPREYHLSHTAHKHETDAMNPTGTYILHHQGTVHHIFLRQTGEHTSFPVTYTCLQHQTHTDQPQDTKQMQVDYTMNGCSRMHISTRMWKGWECASEAICGPH